MSEFPKLVDEASDFAKSLLNKRISEKIRKSEEKGYVVEEKPVVYPTVGSVTETKSEYRIVLSATYSKNYYTYAECIVIKKDALA